MGSSGNTLYFVLYDCQRPSLLLSHSSSTRQQEEIRWKSSLSEIKAVQPEKKRLHTETKQKKRNYSLLPIVRQIVSIVLEARPQLWPEL